MSYEFVSEIGNKKISFSTGEMAKQADGAVLVSCGETVVLATAVADKKASEGRDFFPLSVEYTEKFYASGKIPGGYIKREGRPGNHEILVCRLTDRPLRPLFPKDFVNEVQIIISVLSADREEMPDVLAINAASAALSVSGMPFHGPVGAVRIGRVDGQWVINPTADAMNNSDIDLVVAGTIKAVTMIEGSSDNITEEDMLTAVMIAHDNIKKLCETQIELKNKCNKPEMTYSPKVYDQKLFAAVKERYYTEIENLKNITEKKEREEQFARICEKVSAEMADQFPETISEAHTAVHDIDRDIVRERILNGQRADGRNLNQIRPITIRTGVLPRVHGSALFTRGQTQSLGIITLGTDRDAQKVDMMTGDSVRHFMLHYNFPPFSVGECGRVGGTGRREIGHGMLAERSLVYTLPEMEDFPYTIRVVSEILESNGSSSMATVCSGSLALFDAGVPIKAPIAGIAMGLVMENDRYSVLSDIQGIEDHLGDMDFKVAGTAEGITAFQLDIKIEGITPEIMKVALAQAKEGRLHILSKMNEAMAEPKKELSIHAPRVSKIAIRNDRIGDLIGQGGKNIRSIVEESGAEVSVDDSGVVVIYAPSPEALAIAERLVKQSTDDIEYGAIYTGIVKRILDFGAFVEIAPGKEGLLHISKIAHERVNAVSDFLKIGDEVMVKVIKVERNGKIDLSRKDALPPE